MGCPEKLNENCMYHYFVGGPLDGTKRVYKDSSGGWLRAPESHRCWTYKTGKGIAAFDYKLTWCSNHHAVYLAP